VARNLRRYLAGPFRNLAVLLEQPTGGTVNGLGDLGDGVLAFAVPLALTVICWLGSPRSTALATWAMERTWAVRLDAITLTSSVRFFQ
jgi:hypothetical protein